MKMIKTGRKERHIMFWIVIITAVSWIFTNLTFIYLFITYAKQHKLNELFILWKLAPNQFIYMFLFLPVSIYFTILCVYKMVVGVRSILPDDYTPWIKDFFYINWPAAFMVSIILAAAVTLIFYFGSGFSIDKLKPEYIARAANAMITAAAVENEVTIRDDLTVIDFDSLSDNEYLLLVSSRKYQMKYNLINPITHACTVFQMFVAVFFAAVTVIYTFLICHVIYHEKLYDLAEVKSTVNIITVIAVCFAFFPICYNLYRQRVYDLTKANTTGFQDIFALLLICIVILAIRFLIPENRNNFLSVIINILPAVFTVGGYSIIKTKFSEGLQNFIGVRSQISTHILFIMIFLILAVFVTLVIGTNEN